MHPDALEEELRRRFRTTETRVTLGDHVLQLLHPTDAEALIDEVEFERDERLPYWADLWPSAYALAERVLALAPKQRLLELGCGVGLVSACAAVAGLDVCASDYDANALSFARVNCWRNAKRHIKTQLIDWRDLPACVDGHEIVVASDVLYERPYATHIAHAFKRLLAPYGVGLLADPGRVAVPDFLREAGAQGLQVGEPMQIPYERGTIRQTIRIYDIRRQA